MFYSASTESFGDSLSMQSNPLVLITTLDNKNNELAIVKKEAQKHISILDHLICDVHHCCTRLMYATSMMFAKQHNCASSQYVALCAYNIITEFRDGVAHFVPQLYALFKNSDVIYNCCTQCVQNFEFSMLSYSQRTSQMHSNKMFDLLL